MKVENADPTFLSGIILALKGKIGHDEFKILNIDEIGSNLWIADIQLIDCETNNEIKRMYYIKILWNIRYLIDPFLNSDGIKFKLNEHQHSKVSYGVCTQCDYKTKYPIETFLLLIDYTNNIIYTTELCYDNLEINDNITKLKVLLQT